MNSFKINEELYSKNVELLVQRDSLAAYQATLAPLSHVHLCWTEEKELNLSYQDDSTHFYYHSPQGARQEAKEIFEYQNLTKSDTIYFYGLGLGYVYEAFKPWLNEKKERRFLFIEDDLDVIKTFLYTELATSILQDPQVTFFHVQFPLEEKPLYKILAPFINCKPQYLTLPAYVEHKQKQAILLCYTAFSTTSFLTFTLNEALSGGAGFYNNYFRNLLEGLPRSYLGMGLFDHFQNTPAIICGAGPSLEKNIELLKTFTDKAIIFAGGSSLNILNSHNITPHFGAGLDPNSEQYHRFLTNNTFHLPFFYRTRLNHTALKIHPGPLLYLPGAAGYQLPNWMDEQLGLARQTIEEGHNVVNFCVDLAYLMGCNPIIFVGMDLAFTDIKNYASGISFHPLWLENQHPYQIEQTQEGILAKDIYNKPIQTKWMWIDESTWISQYTSRHSSNTLINATEGGLGFKDIPNIPLKDASEVFLTRSQDLPNHIHLFIQNSSIEFTHAQIIRLFNQLKTELEACQSLCILLLAELSNRSPFSTTPHPAPIYAYSPKAILAELDLEEKIGYTYLLRDFEWANVIEPQLSSDDSSNSLLEWKQLYKRFQLWGKVIAQTITFINQAVANFLLQPPPLKKPPVPFTRTFAQGEIYQFQDPYLVIQDPELGISLSEKISMKELKEVRTTYPNGEKKTECWYKQDTLHGPSRCFSEQGVLLAEGWFVNGKRQGKNYQFYASSALYGIQRYIDNKLHGKQEYFFENQLPHVISHYENGELEGVVSIYNVEGKLTRELHYHKGKREGLERMWGFNGKLILECQYREGQPIDIARQWNEEGHLVKEVSIKQFPHQFDLQMWNNKGDIIRCFKEGIEDFSLYYQEQQAKVDAVDISIQDLLSKLNTILLQNPIESYEDSENIQQQISKIHEDVQEMKNLQGRLLEKMEFNLEQAEEARKKNQSNPFETL